LKVSGAAVVGLAEAQWIDLSSRHSSSVPHQKFLGALSLM
jgi:hypothetical protein